MTVQSWAGLREYRMAIHLSGLKPCVKLLALCLAEHANEKYGFRAWPSQETFAEETGTSRRHVRDRLAELAAAGWVTPEGGSSHRSARYTLHLLAPNRGPNTGPKPGPEEPSKSGPPMAPNEGPLMALNRGPLMAPNRGHDCPKEVLKTDRRTVTETRPTGAALKAAPPGAPNDTKQKAHPIKAQTIEDDDEQIIFEVTA